MHELSITQELVAICLRHAGSRPVRSVLIEIGTLSGVVPEAVSFCFEACTAMTPAAGALLEIRVVEGRGLCRTCMTEQPLERMFDPCPFCGSYAVAVVQGEELRVGELEVADEENRQGAEPMSGPAPWC